jgi:predicted glycosyltransferase
VFFYVQHLLGIGHLQRAAVLAEAIQAAGLETWLITGGAALEEVSIEGPKVVQLPPVRALDAGFALVDENGCPVSDDWKAKRRTALLDVFSQARPRLILIELFPFGRRQMRFELLPLLEAAHAARPRPFVATSLRDILNRQSKPEKAAWMIETFGRFFDLALVHGDRSFIGLEESFPDAEQISDRLLYTGYIVRPREGRADQVQPPSEVAEVLVSAGGGAVGGHLLETALAARDLTNLRARPWRFVAGPNLPEVAFQRLRQAAPRNVTVERSRSDFPRLLAECHLSVSQAGYNTVMEVLSFRKPAVLVPFSGDGESEQTLRARLLAKAGCCEVVDEKDLSPEKLAEAIDRAAGGKAGGGIPPPNIDLDGARNTATILKRILEGRRDDDVA